MRAGRLRFYVAIQRRVDTQECSGQLVFTWADVGNDFASIEDIINRESVQGVQVTAETTTRIRMRWRDDVDETCRIVYSPLASTSPADFDVYDILGPPMTDANTNRTEMILMCAKRRADGWRRGE